MIISPLGYWKLTEVSAFNGFTGLTGPSALAFYMPWRHVVAGVFIALLVVTAHFEALTP